jgi:hypothetical protein
VKLSAYSYLFNSRLRQFDLDGMVTNFTSFFDETVVATIPSEDDTYERLLEWQNKLGAGRFRVIMSDIDITKNNRWDGDLKTVALQACSRSTTQDPRCYVIMDGDEKVNLSYRPLWDVAGIAIHAQPDVDGLLIPVIDLIKDEHHARPKMGYKFRMHKDTVVRRGVIPQAELGNGLFSTESSDSTEPLLANGQLARFVPLKNNVPVMVFHYGHLDAERRAKLNREFWKGHWQARDGKEPNMVLDASELSAEEAVEHGLELP